MNKFMKYTLSAVCALAIVGSAFADTNTVTTTNNSGNWVLTLGGTGQTGFQTTRASSFGVTAGIGKEVNFILKDEIGVRQSINYASSQGGFTLLDSSLYNDWTVLSLFKKRVDVLAGGNVGFTYGNTPIRGHFAPEAGIDIWFTKHNEAAFEALVQYPFTINSPTVTANRTLEYILCFKVRPRWW